MFSPCFQILTPVIHINIQSMLGFYNRSILAKGPKPLALPGKVDLLHEGTTVWGSFGCGDSRIGWLMNEEQWIVRWCLPCCTYTLTRASTRWCPRHLLVCVGPRSAHSRPLTGVWSRHGRFLFSCERGAALVFQEISQGSAECEHRSDKRSKEDNFHLQQTLHKCSSAIQSQTHPRWATCR